MKGNHGPKLLTYLPDTGCSVSPSCFICPLPECRYDEGVWRKRRPARLENDAEIIRLRTKLSLPILEIAGIVGVSERTVARALRAAQGGGI